MGGASGNETIIGHDVKCTPLLNLTLSAMLANVEKRGLEWDERLPHVLFVYRDCQQALTHSGVAVLPVVWARPSLTIPMPVFKEVFSRSQTLTQGERVWSTALDSRLYYSLRNGIAGTCARRAPWRCGPLVTDNPGQRHQTVGKEQFSPRRCNKMQVVSTEVNSRGDVKL